MEILDGHGGKVTKHRGAQLNPPQRKRRNMTRRGHSADLGLRRLVTPMTTEEVNSPAAEMKQSAYGCQRSSPDERATKTK